MIPIGHPDRLEAAKLFQDLVTEIETKRCVVLRNESKRPTEVWLGPTQARIVEVEMNWLDREQRLVHSLKNIDALMTGNIEGCSVMGLIVRLAAQDGVEVTHSTECSNCAHWKPSRFIEPGKNLGHCGQWAHAVKSHNETCGKFTPKKP